LASGVVRSDIGQPRGRGALIGTNTGISTRLGLLNARGTALAQALSSQGLHPRTPGQKPLGSIAELKAWLDQRPLLMDGARWFDAGHWFVAVGYDQNGIYTRDSSGWDTRYRRLQGAFCSSRTKRRVDTATLRCDAACVARWDVCERSGI
jgi:hypothetical protein